MTLSASTPWSEFYVLICADATLFLESYPKSPKTERNFQNLFFKSGATILIFTARSAERCWWSWLVLLSPAGGGQLSSVAACLVFRVRLLNFTFLCTVVSERHNSTSAYQTLIVCACIYRASSRVHRFTHNEFYAPDFQLRAALLSTWYQICSHLY